MYKRLLSVHCRIINLKTTMNIRDDLLKEAMEVTGIKEKTALVHRGLQELINRARIQRLINLGGTDPKAKAASRRKTSRVHSR